MKKLLLVGSASIHVLNYYHLISDFFDEILIASNENVFGNLPFTEVDFSIRNPLVIPSNIKKIKSVIKDFKPSVIHVHQANSVAWLTIKANEGFKIPLVLTAWGDDILVHPRQSRILKNMVVHNLLNADYLTSDSLYMAGEMDKLVPNKSLSVTVANFGIDSPLIVPVKEKIIYSNRLHKPMYRVDKIISAFSKFKQTEVGADWKLYVAATGTETDQLKRQAQQFKFSDDIIFKGWLNAEENRACYSKASVFVSVPDSDATSVSLLEAMSFGCIPVLSNLPANLEWVLDGINGSIVKDLESDFISPVFNLDFEKVIRMNREIISERATKTVSHEKFISIYRKALNK